MFFNYWNTIHPSFKINYVFFKNRSKHISLYNWQQKKIRASCRPFDSWHVSVLFYTFMANTQEYQFILNTCLKLFDFSILFTPNEQQYTLIIKLLERISSQDVIYNWLVDLLLMRSEKRFCTWLHINDDGFELWCEERSRLG